MIPYNNEPKSAKIALSHTQQPYRMLSIATVTTHLRGIVDTFGDYFLQLALLECNVGGPVAPDGCYPGSRYHNCFRASCSSASTSTSSASTPLRVMEACVF